MAGFGNILRRIVRRQREPESVEPPVTPPDALDAPGSAILDEPPAIESQSHEGQGLASVGAEPAPEAWASPVSATVAGSNAADSEPAPEAWASPAGATVAGSSAADSEPAPEAWASPVSATVAGSNAADSEPAPEAWASPVSATVAGSGTAVAVDAGHVRLSDDDAIAKDHLASSCPYCGRPNQRIGARCQNCSRVIVRLPTWAQRRRRHWMLGRISWKRLIFSLAVAFLLVFMIWVNYPFAPNPVVLLKNIQSQMTADIGPGAWTMSGRDLRNSRRADVGFPPPNGEVVWQINIPEPLESEPVAQHSNVFVGSADGVYKLSEHDGRIREGWDGATPGRVTGAAAVVESFLFFGSADHTVNAWNSQNGDAWWTFRAEDTVEVSPVVSDGLVFISSGLGWLYALDAQNGAVIWQTQLDSEASATVAIHDGRLFVGDDIGVFYILSARTGQEWFRYRTLKTIAGAPVISADGLRAYFPSSGQLYAVSANQREAPGLFQFKKIWAQLWLWQVPGVPRPPGQQGGLWRFSPENPLQGIYSSPALADAEDGGVIYVGGYDHFMYALDALTGEPLWTFLAQDGIYASPLIVKDQLIFGDNSGNLYSLNRHDGSVDWTLKLSSGLKIAPALSNETLIVRTDNGDIYGIR